MMPGVSWRIKKIGNQIGDTLRLEFAESSLGPPLRPSVRTSSSLEFSENQIYSAAIRAA